MAQSWVATPTTPGAVYGEYADNYHTCPVDAERRMWGKVVKQHAIDASVDLTSHNNADTYAGRWRQGEQEAIKLSGEIFFIGPYLGHWCDDMGMSEDAMRARLKAELDELTGLPIYTIPDRDPERFIEIMMGASKRVFDIGGY
jgi:hypothetical protein